eukprot:427301-Rhodomonas_salina.2
MLPLTARAGWPGRGLQRGREPAGGRRRCAGPHDANRREQRRALRASHIHRRAAVRAEPELGVDPAGLGAGGPGRVHVEPDAGRGDGGHDARVRHVGRGHVPAEERLRGAHPRARRPHHAALRARGYHVREPALARGPVRSVQHPARHRLVPLDHRGPLEERVCVAGGLGGGQGSAVARNYAERG